MNLVGHDWTEIQKILNSVMVEMQINRTGKILCCELDWLGVEGGREMGNLNLSGFVRLSISTSTGVFACLRV